MHTDCRALEVSPPACPDLQATDIGVPVGDPSGTVLAADSAQVMTLSTEVGTQTYQNAFDCDHASYALLTGPCIQTQGLA